MIVKLRDGSLKTYYSGMTASSFSGEDLTIIVVNDSKSVLDADAEVTTDTKIKDEVIVSNVATLTIVINNTDPFSGITLTDAEQAKAYDARIEGVASDNSALIVLIMKEALPAGLDPAYVKAYLEGNAMTAGSAKADLTADGSFYYDAATGDVYVAVVSADISSNYTFVYPRDVYTITYEGIDESMENEYPAFYYAGIGLTLVDPVREGYTFDGWYEGETKVTAIGTDRAEDVTLTAHWIVNKYTITFVDEDGTTTLYSSEFDYGTTPAYAGETPTKAADDQYTYTFAGWSPVISAVDRDATYTATYEKADRQYNGPVWTWNEDHTSATATFTAADDETFVQTVTDSEITA